MLLSVTVLLGAGVSLVLVGLALGLLRGARGPASRRVKDARRESEARMRAIVDTAVDAILTIDVKGIVDSLNPATERLFGYRTDEVLGHNVRLLMPEPFQSGHDGYLQRYRRTGERRIIGIGREVMGRRKDGTVFPMDLAVSETRLGERRIYTGILRDITERKRAEADTERLLGSEREARERAE